MPAKHQVRRPQSYEISGKVEQEREIIQLAELHPTPLQSHQHIHHVFTATRQFLPLFRRRPIDIQGPGIRCVRGLPRLWFRSDRVWREIAGGLQELASQGVKPVLARHCFRNLRLGQDLTEPEPQVLRGPARRQAWDIDQSLLKGNHHGVGAVVGLQLAQKAAYVGFHRVD